MTHPRDLPFFPLLQFYTTTPYGCSYLPGRIARSQVATPIRMIDSSIYSELVHLCNECQPVRLDVNQFVANRSQRRTLTRNASLTVRDCDLTFHEEHYLLYRDYQAKRHPGGGMDQDSREQYVQFLLQTHVTSRLVEFRENGVLRMVSIIDVLDDGLSAIYTFYDCEVPHAGYGTFGILWQIAECRRAGLPWLYLGYWIRDSKKMAYKENFQPLHVLRNGQWQRLSHRADSA